MCVEHFYIVKYVIYTYILQSNYYFIYIGPCIIVIVEE